MRLQRLSWFVFLATLAGMVIANSIASICRSQDATNTKKTYLDSYTGADAEKIGSEACFTSGCHLKDKLIPKNPASHIAVFDSNKDSSFYGYGCEACHGPGSKHYGDISAIINPAKMDKNEITDLCAKCHPHRGLYDKDAWLTSHHFVKAGIACLACHAGHSEFDKHLVKDKIVDVCFVCHAQLKDDFMAGKHNSADPKTDTCVKCHNPHQ
jgi:predicted CXXCH cytochrome family protein